MQILNLLIKPIWILVIDRAVQEALPLEVYGNYFSLFNFSLLFFIILDLGLNTYSTTQVSRSSGKIKSLVGNIIGLKILLSLVYLIIATGVGMLLGYRSKEFSLLLLLFPLQILTSMNQYLRSIVNSLQRFKWDGIFMVLDRVLVVVICALMIWGNITNFGLTIERFIYAQLTGVVIVLFALLLFLKNHLTSVSLSFSLDNLLPVLRKSWPFALMITLMGMFNYVDSVMLKYLRTDADAGIYALGYRLYYALLMFAQIFSGVLLAFFSKNLKNREVIHEIGTYTIKFLLLVGIVVAGLSFSYNQELMDMLYPTKSSTEAAQAFSLLMFGFLGSALVLVFGTLLTAALELKNVNIAAGVTLGINLLLNIQLIPAYGAVGAATATLASQLLFGGICFFISQKKFKFPFSPSASVLQVLSTVILLLVIVYGKQYLVNPIVHLAVITLFVIAVAYAIKLFRVNQLKSLFRK